MSKAINSRYVTVWLFSLSFTMLCLGVYALPPDGEVWGKRIWDKKVDDEHTLVVDERGVKTVLNNPDREVLQGLTYYWRLLKNGEAEGPTLFALSGVKQFSGTGTLFDPIDVICADMIGDDLVTAYNQRGSCWAVVAHRNVDGTFDQKPSPGALLGVATIGTSMKSAHFKRGSDGVFRLTVEDDKRHTTEFELRARENEPTFFNWVKVGDPTTRPADNTNQKK